MKVNEIPEKIYLSYEPDDEDDKDHIFIDYMWHRHPFEGKNLKSVEYVRTDALIEKVKEWLDTKDDKDYYTIGYIKNHFQELIKEIGL